MGQIHELDKGPTNGRTDACLMSNYRMQNVCVLLKSARVSPKYPCQIKIVRDMQAPKFPVSGARVRLATRSARVASQDPRQKFID